MILLVPVVDLQAFRRQGTQGSLTIVLCRNERSITHEFTLAEELGE